jgi:hypothetical protein
LVISLLVVCEGWVCVSDLGRSLVVVVVSLVCAAGAVVVCVLGGVGSMVVAPCRAFCGFGRFVNF